MFFKREKKDDVQIAGIAIADIKEKEYQGKAFFEVGVGVGKDEQGNDLPLINVTMWGRKLDIKKGDRVFACGKLKVTQKDEKKYFSLTADFIAKEESEKRQATPPELTETEDDDLPF